MLKTKLFLSMAVVYLLSTTQLVYGKPSKIHKKSHTPVEHTILTSKGYEFHILTYPGNIQYVHFKFTLTPENLVLELPGYELKYGHISNWEKNKAEGNLEIFIKKEAVPLLTPACEKYVILRSTRPKSYNNVDQTLLTKVEEVVTKGKPFEVVVEPLYPEIKISEGKTTISLSGGSCNLHLRTHHNSYIPTTGVLSQN